MDFFEHQESARRKTHLLVFYFALAVAGIIGAVYGLVILITMFLGGDESGPSAIVLWDPTMLLFTAAGTVAVVFLASTFKTLQLSGGGAVVARELGGREIDPNTTDFHERRLLNLVEEMAIASGVPVPTVFVMDGEESINAFAAGRTPSDAVVGVTRGCMTLLTRDELQGVIAHEFSHILNGDMRLNIRLMGLIFGILFLSLIGEFILRSTFRGGWSSNRKESGGIALVMIVAGLGLLLIGMVGSFFANLIKASVSRQREFLADASAVQFTRNPDGIGGALKKIGGLSAGSRMTHPMAKDASHLFFGSAFSASFLATHPPLGLRIRRLLPHWDGEFGEVSQRPVAEASEGRRERGGRRSESVSGFAMQGSGSLPLASEEAMESFRTVHAEQVDLGREMHDALPQEWLEACHATSGAQAMVFALLLAQDEALRQSELKHLQRETDDATFSATVALFGEIRSLHSAVKIGLIDLSIPSLRRLAPPEYDRFRGLVHRLVESDGQVDLFEFMLLRIVTRHLDTWFHRRPPEPIRYRRIDPLLDEAGILLSTLAAMSHPESETAAVEAFASASDHLRSRYLVEVPHQPGERCGLDQIERALDAFAHASPVLKRDFLEACSLSVMADSAVSSREAELIRAVADSIGCPIPPFVRTAKRI